MIYAVCGKCTWLRQECTWLPNEYGRANKIFD